MVFGSLLEYAIVGYLGKRIAMRKSSLEKLSKQQEEHRKKCTAAFAAATIENFNQFQSGENTLQQNQSINQNPHQQNHNQPTNQAQNQTHIQHLHIHSQPVQPQLICATTGLPLDPSIQNIQNLQNLQNLQMTCGLKTPVRSSYH